MRHSHAASDLIRLFNAAFAASHNTVLLGGGSEPVYLPADVHNPRHRIIFTRDYFASALHEIAHWCLAGKQRRLQVDYGYWYHPDGRTAGEQAKFERVECKPQAIEWAFHLAAGSTFRVSADNLTGAAVNTSAFRERILVQLHHYCQRGFPPRAQRCINILCGFYRQTWQAPAAA